MAKAGGSGPDPGATSRRDGLGEVQSLVFTEKYKRKDVVKSASNGPS